MAPFLTFALALAALTAVALVGRRRGTPLFRLDQFRPAAPLAGHLPDQRDADRTLADLQAAADRSAPGIAAGRELTAKQSS
ncbi:hypothetical protein ACFWPA_17365 [Rhodococcus sp. NPDC058505]|uniref:hypothetical protein n=1 Tax=unclassified Rhodococcus (in: high G+C Gram-positive bacteria) TaxID=192944 RepID=UPI00364A9A4E